VIVHDLWLTDDEKAIYYAAFEVNGSAMTVLGNPTLVVGDLGRRQVAVVVDDRQVRGVIVVQPPRRLGGKRKVLGDENIFFLAMMVGLSVTPGC
jgi:hypothetical protein